MSNKICITSGGTGGHIIPARCLAQNLAQQGYEVLFCGDNKYRSYIKKDDNFTSKIIISSQIRNSPICLIKAGVKISLGIIQSLYLFLTKRPQYVFAFGGYATFPILIVAVITKTKIILHEQNSHLGKVNRIFSKYAYKIALSFAKTSGIRAEFNKKTVFVGNPVRNEILKLHKIDYKLPEYPEEPEIRTDNKMGYNVILKSDFDHEYDLSEESFKILIIGGSGGAKIFSEILPKAFFNLSEDIKERIKVTQQCRSEILQTTFEQYKSFNINIVVDSFFDNMPQLIAESHLIIARAGSSSIFEFCTAKKPMVLIPFAKAADNHQEKNAQYMAQNGAAIIVKEEEFTINKANELLKNLIDNRETLEKMSKNAANLAICDATNTLSQLISH